MAGGSWTVQNKIRPGAYINFEPMTVWSGTTQNRGVVTMPLFMDWGPERTVVTIESVSFWAGNMTALGYRVSENESILARECLRHCQKLLAYRLNSGGNRATATLGNLTVTAVYSGLRGNQLSVAVTTSGDDYVVKTYLAAELMDSQTVAAGAELVDNEWVTFSSQGDLTATAATPLTGGANGTIAVGAYSAYFEAVAGLNWKVMGVPSDDASLPPLVCDFIRQLREVRGKKVQGVVLDYSADYEGIISSKQGYRTATTTVTPAEFVAWVAGLTAGSAINQSNTYALVADAEEIINPLDDAAIESGLREGYFLLSRRTDGKIIVEQDINTLVNGDGSKSNALCKNRVIRVLDEIAATVSTLFENYYIGKIDNNETGRALFKGDILQYFDDLTALNAVTNFDGASDVEVLPGHSGDSVIVNLAVQPVDAMEKLYMSVEVQV